MGLALSPALCYVKMGGVMNLWWQRLIISSVMHLGIRILWGLLRLAQSERNMRKDVYNYLLWYSEEMVEQTVRGILCTDMWITTVC